MPFRIFLSSTYSDLIEERQAVERVIVALGQHLKGMEHFFAREETPLDTCLAEVAQSQMFVLVVGHRYGTTDANGISYAERGDLRLRSRIGYDIIQLGKRRDTSNAYHQHLLWN